MLELVRGRDWKVVHTVCDDEEGNLADLSDIAFTCQIREKTGIKNAKGFFDHKLVADVTVSVDTIESQITLLLPSLDTLTIREGSYQIDLVGEHAGTGELETFLEPEEVVVTNRPTKI